MYDHESSEPGVVAELARARNRVEDPHPLAVPDVEPADVALDVALAARHAARQVRRADDDRVAGDDGRRMESDLAGDEIDRLIVVLLEVDDTARAERLNRDAGPGVERDQAIAGRDVENPLVLAVGPVGQAASGELTRRRLGALALALAVHPHQLAGRRVECHDRAARPGRRIHDALDHQRRRLELVLRPWSEALGLEAPGDFQLAEVVGVDLIERRVARVAEVGAVGRPLAVLRP